MEHRFIRCTYYTYYDARTSVEYNEDEFYNEDDWDSMESHSEFFKIDTKEELIDVLKILCEENEYYKHVKVKVEDFIKLLKDTNLGSVFFDRFCLNIDWLLDHPDVLETISSENHFLLTDDEQNILPIFKDNKEFQKFSLQTFIKNDIEYEPLWFDIKEDELNDWKFEFCLTKLKKELSQKETELQKYKSKIQRIEKEITELTNRITSLENTKESEDGKDIER